MPFPTGAPLADPPTKPLVPPLFPEGGGGGGCAGRVKLPIVKNVRRISILFMVFLY